MLHNGPVVSQSIPVAASGTPEATLPSSNTSHE
jgi:hypothetical protein